MVGVGLCVRSIMAVIAGPCSIEGSFPAAAAADRLCRGIPEQFVCLSDCPESPALVGRAPVGVALECESPVGCLHLLACRAGAHAKHGTRLVYVHAWRAGRTA